MTDSIKQIKKPSQRQFVKDWPYLTRGQVDSDGTNLPAKYMLPQYFLNNVAESGLLDVLQSERAVKALQKEVMV